jgi:hypothetical protein
VVVIGSTGRKRIGLCSDERTPLLRDEAGWRVRTSRTATDGNGIRKGFGWLSGRIEAGWT